MEFKTTGKERLFFAMFMAGQSLFNQLVNSFSQKFLTEAGIAAAVVGTIILFVRVFDAVNDPFFGGIVDRSSLKGGKFMPWLRISPYLMLIFGVALFAMPASLPIDAKIAYAAAASVLFSMAYTICDVPVFSMISAVTDNIQERTHIISRNGIGGAIGLFAMSIAVPALYPRIGWGATAGAVCIAGMAIMLPMGRAGKERFINKDTEKVTAGAMLRYLRRNKYLQMYFIGLFLLFSTATTQQAIPFFADFNLGDVGAITTMTLAIAVPTLLFIIMIPILTKRFDKFQIFITCILGQIIMSVVSFFAGYSNMPLFYALLVIRGLFIGGNAVMMLMFTPDFIEYGEFKTGKRLQGTANSIQTFICKVMTAAAGAVIMFLMSAAGFISGTDSVQSDGALNMIWFLVTLAPVIGCALSLVIFSRYKLRDRDVQLMAKANSGEISKEEAEAAFSRKY